MQELSIQLPTKRQAAIEIGLAIASEIFEGKREVFEGVQCIIWKAIDAYPFYEETIHYCYDSIGFEKVYGLFDTLDDLKGAGNQWHSDKTNQELEEELNEQLVTALKAWTERMREEASIPQS